MRKTFFVFLALHFTIFFKSPCTLIGWKGCICVPWGLEETSVRLIGWAGCMCAPWGLEQTSVRLLGGWGTCVFPGAQSRQLGG